MKIVFCLSLLNFVTYKLLHYTLLFSTLSELFKWNSETFQVTQTVVKTLQRYRVNNMFFSLRLY